MREAIFDLDMNLQPPHPGPYAGVPCGGVGSGAIGRGTVSNESFATLSTHIVFAITIAMQTSCYKIALHDTILL